MVTIRLLKALAALVAHVEGVVASAQLPGVCLVSWDWMREFDKLDAAVEQLCKVSGVAIEQGPRDKNLAEALQNAIVWFRGHTNLKLIAPTPAQALLVGTDLSAIGDHSGWLRRMELVKIKAEIAELSERRVRPLLSDQTSQPVADTEELDAETRAIAILAKFPKLTSLEEVAKLSGCSRQTATCHAISAFAAAQAEGPTLPPPPADSARRRCERLGSTAQGAYHCAS